MTQLPIGPRRMVVKAAVAASAAALSALKPAHAVKPREIVIWYSIDGAKGMRAIGERYFKDTGVKVIVETPDEGQAKFQQAASAGKGPDIFIFAHDRIGEWVAGGLLHSVNPSRRVFNEIDSLGWQGFSWRGRYWGYPLTFEAITLVYNKALIAKPPQSFEEIFTLDAQLSKQGKKALIWDYANAYFTWPLLAAAGGYSFKQNKDGTFDANDVGVDNAGALAGAQLLDRMIREDLMPRGVGYAEMETAISQGKAAMMINGPWSWVNLRKANIDFAAAPLPSFMGKPCVPFVGVKGMLINRSTKVREIAVDFIENYILSQQGLRDINDSIPLGAVANKAYFQELSKDPNIAAIMTSARQGLPTPAVPEMGRFWAAMKSSLLNLTEGRQSPKDALAAAARQMRSGI
jgi:maltose/maltodextrin transport system substrate-binding protein